MSLHIVIRIRDVVLVVFPYSDGIGQDRHGTLENAEGVDERWTDLIWHSETQAVMRAGQLTLCDGTFRCFFYQGF